MLLVEDDPLIREFIGEALRDEGFEVIHVASGEEALTGQMDGWEIAEHCRKDHPELPVIYATGFSPVAHRPVAGSTFLQKPFHPHEIVRAVKQATQGLNE